MSGHDLLYPGPQDRIRTWGRLTVVIAGLERHVQLRPPGLSPRAFERRDLGMVAAGMGVPALSDHRTIANHSFLSPIRTLTVGAGLQLCSSLHRLTPKICTLRVRGLSWRLINLHGFTAGAGISPAPESYLKLSYHTATVRTRKLFTHRF